MTRPGAVRSPTSFSKSERYMAFLLTQLPRLAPLSLSTIEEPLKHRSAPLEAALNAAVKRPGIFLEFGVYKGTTITWCAKKQKNRKFFGFDSFEGFPTDNRVDWDQDFSLPSLPEVPSNVTLIKGWFKDTLPGFLARNDQPIAMVNIDCDIYSSTVDVFSALRAHGHFKPGLVISFDELINYRGYPWNEMLALFEALDEDGLGIRWIACHKRVRLIDETIDCLKRKKHPAWNDDIENGYRQQASLVLTSKPIDYNTRYPHLLAKVERLARDFDELTAARMATAS